jgi:hypothetical protein
MKIIDQTPFRAENGEINIINRIQATLKFGFSWYGRVMAQEKIIPILDKQLERGYVLLRNVMLHGTDILLPMVLIGPAGAFALNIIPDRGVFRAKGEEWGTIDNEQFMPSSSNPMRETAQISRVLQTYLDRAGFKGMVKVEPLLIAADPGAHVETVRPAVRVVMFDALERFAISMVQARATLSPEAASKIGDIIINGGSLKPESAATPAPAQPLEDRAVAAYNPYGDGSFQTQESSSGSLTDDLTFSFDDEEPAEAEPEKKPSASAREVKKPAKPAAKAGARKSGSKGGMTKAQWAVLIGAAAAELIILAVFVWLLLSSQ